MFLSHQKPMIINRLKLPYQIIKLQHQHQLLFLIKIPQVQQALQQQQKIENNKKDKIL
jgi:hypothetical protein